jgi:NDP-sugar pyrophosphorylase family protein
MPIGEYPILEVVIRQLASNGFKHITLAVNHQADIIKSYFNSGEKWGIRIDYSLERTPLGTMGPLKLIKDLPENFLVMNGDVLTDLNYRQFYDFHMAEKQLFTISSCQRKQRSEYGVLQTDKEGMIYGFQEKPIVNYEVSMGIYMLSKQVMQSIPEGQAYGFDELVLDFIKAEMPLRVKRHNGCWLDIGRPDDYQKAIDIYENNSNIFITS